MDTTLSRSRPRQCLPCAASWTTGNTSIELSKKDHQNRRHQKSTQVKEIKLRPRTDKHDLEIKIRQIKGFLADGNKTKVLLTYRGREMANQEMGRTLMNTVIAELRRDRHDRICPPHGRAEPDHDRRAEVSCWSGHLTKGCDRHEEEENEITQRSQKSGFTRTGTGKLVQARKPGSAIS